MRVAHFTAGYPPRTCGVSRYVKTLVDGFFARSHTALVVTSTPTTERPVVFVPPLITAPPPTGTPFSIGETKALTRRIAQFGPDVIHVHNPYGLGWSAAAVATALRVPLVFTYHSAYDQLAAMVAPRLALPARASVIMYANRADVVVAPSTTVAVDLQQRLRVPVVVLPSGVDVSAIARAREPHAGYVIGYVGRLAQGKNLDVLLTAAHTVLQQLPDARLEVVGDGTERARLEHTASTWPCHERVRFHGALSGEALWRAYAGFDVFATPSCIEVQPLVVAEALAAGVPVVAFAIGGITDMVDASVGWLCTPGDVQSFTKALLCAARTRPTTAACRKRAAAFSVDTFVERTLNLYRRVCSARRRAA